MPCSKCGGTGKIPLQNYKHGFYNCACQEVEPERFIEVKPSDFDFACSNTFRGASFDYCGVKDPARETTIREIQTKEIITERVTDLRSIQGQLMELRSKLTAKNKREESY